MTNKLTSIARDILSIENDIRYRLDYREENPSVDDFELYMFEQVWGSTALGFGGIGGQAMTSAMTYVFVPLHCNQKCVVYFDGRFAYTVPYSDVFMQDVLNRKVESVARSGKYTGTTENV